MSQQLFDKVAFYLEKNPNSTRWEIEKGCAVVNVSEVLGKMASHGYGIARTRSQRYAATPSGQRPLNVQAYKLTHRPQALSTPAAG